MRSRAVVRSIALSLGAVAAGVVLTGAGTVPAPEPPVGSTPADVAVPTDVAETSLGRLLGDLVTGLYGLLPVVVDEHGQRVGTPAHVPVISVTAPVGPAPTA
jgi:hypothetical protein